MSEANTRLVEVIDFDPFRKKRFQFGRVGRLSPLDRKALVLAFSFLRVRTLFPLCACS